ncbi:MAG: integrase family site specific recombinase [Microviridae sp.]|nr:MAG: integrase family site specific recombinase [Microviridae sp.]
MSHHIHGLDLSTLGISKSVESSVQWKYFVCIASLSSDRVSLPVRVAPSKLEQFYTDYPSSDFIVIEVFPTSRYRCECGQSHSITDLF